MAHTQSEIIMALKIIKDTCDEHHCYECPFEDRNYRGQCKISAVDPGGWDIATESVKWYAFEN